MTYNTTRVITIWDRYADRYNRQSDHYNHQIATLGVQSIGLLPWGFPQTPYVCLPNYLTAAQAVCPSREG
jgi:hypothetical protein